MCDKVKEPTDNVWQLTLQLKDIVQLICAQKNPLPEVVYLDVLIQEYLACRFSLFPGHRLKPKHHLWHYPALILKCGPLIRLWTMRFDSKHSYFKRCARNLKNFKNLCFTLSERHQMYQAYLSEGSMCDLTLREKNSTAFYPELYGDFVKDPVK